MTNKSFGKSSMRKIYLEPLKMDSSKQINKSRKSKLLESEIKNIKSSGPDSGTIKIGMVGKSLEYEEILN